MKIYAYKNCDTCRKALKFLRANGVAFVEIAICDTPPTIAELHSMLVAQGNQLRKLFNTSGSDYKALGLAQKLPTLSEVEALRLLSSNGNLVKRPFVIGTRIHLVGYDESLWRNTLL
ncbi:MAG: Spx/MgsR family RNA polymerase-binding regulatory protein [Chthoniobacterales bacterium]